MLTATTEMYVKCWEISHDSCWKLFCPKKLFLQMSLEDCWPFQVFALKWAEDTRGPTLAKVFGRDALVGHFLTVFPVCFCKVLDKNFGVRHLVPRRQLHSSQLSNLKDEQKKAPSRFFFHKEDVVALCFSLNPKAGLFSVGSSNTHISTFICCHELVESYLLVTVLVQSLLRQDCLKVATIGLTKQTELTAFYPITLWTFEIRLNELILSKT